MKNIYYYNEKYPLLTITFILLVIYYLAQFDSSNIGFERLANAVGFVSVPYVPIWIYYLIRFLFNKISKKKVRIHLSPFLIPYVIFINFFAHWGNYNLEENKPIIVNREKVSISNGKVYYKHNMELYTGIVVTRNDFFIDSTSFKNGIKNGFKKSFYRNGNIGSIEMFEKGNLILPKKEWYKNGQLYMDHTNLTYKEYYNSGQLFYESRSANDSIFVKHYYSNAQIRFDGIKINDKFIRMKCFGEKGEYSFVCSKPLRVYSGIKNAKDYPFGN